ncbi:MAG: protein translocase subunit SecD [Acidobacteriota bacterium]
MKEKLISRGVIIFASLFIALWSIYPPMDRKGPDGKEIPGRIRLGLDLKGGTYLVLEVVSDEAVGFRTSEDKDRLERELKDKAISFESLGNPDIRTIRVAGVDPNKMSDLASLASERFPNYTFRSVSGQPPEATLTLADAAEKKERTSAVDQALETIRNRVDQFGVAEPSIQRLARTDRISVQFPGVDDPERIKSILKRTAVLELKIVEAGPAPTQEKVLESSGGKQPKDTIVVPSVSIKRTEDGTVVGNQQEDGWYLLRKDSIITGMDLKGATRGQDQFGQASVNFSLKSEGSDKFGRATKENLGKQLAIVLDGKVKSAPTIRAEIRDRGEITGNFSIPEADDLSLVLRSGSLPASIRFLEERTVGPGIGRDAIKDGLLASGVGFAIVLGFMLVWYKGAGINAITALVLNIFIMLAVMAWFHATLTLPGIAGYVLTIGMAVDANVLIFERIKEELRWGKTARAAIDAGFARAFATILDTHVTTLIAALFLFRFGTGPIKGFAVSLTAGLAASMFTSIVVSHWIFDLMTYFRGRERISI